MKHTIRPPLGIQDYPVIYYFNDLWLFLFYFVDWWKLWEGKTWKETHCLPEINQYNSLTLFINYFYRSFSHDNTTVAMLEFKINSPVWKREENWDELTFAKTSGTVTEDREKIGQ